MSGPRAVLAGTLRPLVWLLPRSARKLIRHRIRETAIRYVQWRYRLGAEDLRKFLLELGVRRGDVLFVHSSFDAFQGFVDLPPLAVIKVLQEAVGPTGVLLMPTLPFAGSAVKYVQTNPSFDVRRTPSRMGLLTELFRRMPGVVRSLHPTHSVVAWGAKAADLTADHQLAGTPCGKPSPYEKLLEHDGRILMLGTGILAMTFFHTVDELLEEDLPYTAFTKETYDLWSRDAGGGLVETRTRLYDSASAEARRRFERRLPALMKRRGTWRQSRIGNLRAILIDAKDVLDALRQAVS
jgi:aminoglycoside 3-N-acetyltransferase